MRRRDKSKNIERINLLAEQRYLASKGVVTENSVTQALMGAANSGTLGGGIYDIVKNFGKNAVLSAMQALMGTGDIDPAGVKKVGLIQTIKKLQDGTDTIEEGESVNVTEDEGEHERYSQYNIDTNARLKKYASEKEVGTDWSEIRDYFLEQADPYNMKSHKETYDIYFKLVDEFLTKHGY